MCACCSVIIVVTIRGGTAFDTVIVCFIGVDLLRYGIKLTAVNGVRAGLADFPRRDVFDLPLELQLTHGYLIARLNIGATGKIFIRDSADSGCGNGCCVCFRGRPCPKCHSVILIGIGTDAESGGC